MNSTTVTACQICGNAGIRPFFSVGWLPPVNTLRKIGERAVEEPRYPAELLHCDKCGLVQIGTSVDPSILFPPDYAYRSGSTKALRDNFADLCREVQELGYGKAGDLVVDVGCNDGTLLKHFKDAGFGVCGVDPVFVEEALVKNGVWCMVNAFLCKDTVKKVIERCGKAKVVTACNVFAHTPDPHEFVECVKEMLAEDGVFVIEVQDLLHLQYDTIYHEHLRYYTLRSLEYLLNMHGMLIFKCKAISTHGGSLRAYVCRKNVRAVENSWTETTDVEAIAKRSIRQKLELLVLLAELKRGGSRIYGIGCPSRAVTLINYCGLDGILDCVCEVANSPKIGHCVPGTSIPIVKEEHLYLEQPSHALMLSWHLFDLPDKLRAKGFKRRFIKPLPNVEVLYGVVEKAVVQ